MRRQHVLHHHAAVPRSLSTTCSGCDLTGHALFSSKHDTLFEAWPGRNYCSSTSYGPLHTFKYSCEPAPEYATSSSISDFFLLFFILQGPSSVLLRIPGGTKPDGSLPGTEPASALESGVLVG